jgi:hypothetical protein
MGREEREENNYFAKLFSTGLMSVVPTGKSRDYLTSSFAVFLIW